MMEFIPSEVKYPLGIFAMMATMAAIIAGSTGIRLLFIEKVYRRTIKSISESMEEHAKERSLIDFAESYKGLSDVRGKNKSNRNGVRIDGFCIVIILILWLVTAVGLNPNLSLTAGLTFMVFLVWMLHFHRHVGNALNPPS